MTSSVLISVVLFDTHTEIDEFDFGLEINWNTDRFIKIARTTWAIRWLNSLRVIIKSILWVMVKSHRVFIAIVRICYVTMQSWTCKKAVFLGVKIEVTWQHQAVQCVSVVHSCVVSSLQYLNEIIYDCLPCHCLCAKSRTCCTSYQ